MIASIDMFSYSRVKEWLNALENATQGKSFLTRIHDEGLTQCCLGVLCDVHTVPFRVMSGVTRQYEFGGLETRTADVPMPWLRFTLDAEVPIDFLSLLIWANDNLADGKFTAVRGILSACFSVRALLSEKGCAAVRNELGRVRGAMLAA